MTPQFGSTANIEREIRDAVKAHPGVTHDELKGLVKNGRRRVKDNPRVLVHHGALTLVDGRYYPKGASWMIKCGHY